MSLENKEKQLQKEVQDYRNAEMTNKNRLRNPWFRAYRDSLIFSTLLLEDAQRIIQNLEKELAEAVRVANDRGKG